VIDLRPEVMAALRELLPEIEAAQERAAERAVRRVLEEASADQVIDTDGLRELLGCPTRTAAKRRVDRDPELRALALTGGRGERWTFRRSEVLALLAARRAERAR
jgi:putative intracellular protease/amidase